jgi:hypothetical protein
MFNPKIAIFLCALGFVGFFVNGATTVQLASFFSIVTSSVLIMRYQNFRLGNSDNYPTTK